jgi:hypothetical protein
MKLRARGAWLAAFALTLAGCKDAASTVVEKSVGAAKEVTKGIEEGADKGRKSGESLDGATIISAEPELAGKGSFALYAVSGSDAATDTEITLAFENTTDKPLRITKLQIVTLDKEGFVKSPTGLVGEVTVPARAKNKLSFHVAEKADKLAKVRVWGKDLEISPAVRK